MIRRSAADTLGNSYRVHEPMGKPRGLLVLLPGYGSGVEGFAASSYTPSTLPARMAEQGVLTIVAVPDAETLYEVDRPLHVLDSIIAEVVQKYGLPRDRVVVGGFSSGGAGAVRYAQLCAQGSCKGTRRVAGVFGVDPPLDFERLYRSSELIVQRNAPRSNIAEERMITETLRRGLGGTPEQAAEAYRRQSPLSASIPDGGNAQLLYTTPIRLYTEPDVHWWMENRNLDYHGMNAVDHAALINLLRVAGNTRAELITTTGKGVRPNGTRHPHSWSIVDEADLAQWISGLLLSQTQGESMRTDRRAVVPGIVPYVNPSPSLMEQVVRRARAMGGAQVSVPVWLPGGGGQVRAATVTFSAADSVQLSMGGVEVRLRSDPKGRLLGCTIPSQGLTLERAAAGTP